MLVPGWEWLVFVFHLSESPYSDGEEVDHGCGD